MNCRFHVLPCVVYISVVILCTVLATFQPKVVVACYSLNHYYISTSGSAAAILDHFQLPIRDVHSIVGLLDPLNKEISVEISLLSRLQNEV